MKGYVYLIESAYGYKIGKSKTPKTRSNLFSVKLPFEIEMIKAIEVEHYHQVEKDLHKHFEERHLNGEWFDLTKEEVEEFESLVYWYEQIHIILDFGSTQENKNGISKRSLKKKKKKFVAQSRRLIEGKYNFTIWELRLYLKMVEMIQPTDISFQPCRIYFKDLIKEHGGNSRNEYKVIKESADRLLKKIVQLEYEENGKDVIVKTPLLFSAKHPKNWRDNDSSAYLDLSFDPHLKEYLLDLKGNFLLYDRRNILTLKSKFSVRIYQLLKSHERKDQNSVVVEYSVKELREMLLVDDEGNPTKQYKHYNTFKKRVLLQAQKELQEHTDIAFSFDEIKEGRKVGTIRFFVRKNRKNKPKKGSTKIKEISQKATKQERSPQAPRPQPNTTKAATFDDSIQNSPAYQKLMDVGVGMSTAYELATAYDVSYILTSIKQAQQIHKISPKHNFAGFVITCIKEETYKAVIEKKQAQKTKEQKRQQRLQTHLQISEMQQTYETEKKQYIDTIRNGLDETEKQEIIKTIRSKYKRASQYSDEKLLHSTYFRLVVIEQHKGTAQFPTEYTTFAEYMQKQYQVKIDNKNNEGWYEIIS